ncbi:PREDICTED: uncharacterized protein LOC108558607 [Nicrophorus vespilloides]|uniref:Uncharacterized protein LOC108558607 n=1 Tax=Nicrophorus vespilloides TaxID=110193 RepID=A0ABM1M913_NICVS|nr:PREDICTED: uncharacterized protein LOC108558607 [Nicrophorus vespilloides]
MLRILCVLFLITQSIICEEDVPKEKKAKQITYGDPFRGIQYNPYINPQFQYNGYYPNLAPNDRGFAVQPPVVLLGGHDQPIFLNPNLGPGNFLIPQPQPHPQPGFDPNIFRTNGFAGQRPVFVSGFPKPAFVPPVEKDAEEIPNILKNKPIYRPTTKPEKYELEESEESNPTEKPTKKVTLKRPKKPTTSNLRPGQRFFILNGQHLFANYPFVDQYSPEQRYSLPPYFYSQQNILPNPEKIHVLKPTPEELKQNNYFEESKGGQLLRDILPLQLHNQVISQQHLLPVVLKKESSPEEYNLHTRYSEKIEQDEQPLPIYEGNVHPGIAYDYFRSNDDDSDSIVIDAKYEDATLPPDNESETVESQTEKPAESSVAQAQPGAIALAGVGGVASAGPRGTALVGEGGLAISSPHATAVAGPSKDEPPKDKKKEKATKRQ